MGGPESPSEIRIEVEAPVQGNKPRWRTTYGQKLAAGNYNYILIESLISQTQIIQVTNYGSSIAGIDKFQPDKKLIKSAAFWEVSMEEAGGGRLLGTDLLLGFIPNKKGITDLHLSLIHI